MGEQRRPVAEIEADAEELADWFENFDPVEATKVPVREYLLERAARTQAQCERAVAEAVHDAVASGTPWSRVAEILKIDPADARDRYNTEAAPQRAEGIVA